MLQYLISAGIGIGAGAATYALIVLIVRLRRTSAERARVVLFLAEKIKNDQVRFSAISQTKLIYITIILAFATLIMTVNLGVLDVGPYYFIVGQSLGTIAFAAASYVAFDLYIFLSRYRNFPQWKQAQLSKIETLLKGAKQQQKVEILPPQTGVANQGAASKPLSSSLYFSVNQSYSADGEELRWLSGKVQNWKDDRGFGFVESGDGEALERFFFHYSHICGTATPSAEQELVFLPLIVSDPAGRRSDHRHAFLVCLSDTIVAARIYADFDQEFCLGYVDDFKGNTASIKVFFEKPSFKEKVRIGDIVHARISLEGGIPIGRNAHPLAPAKRK